MINYIDDFLGYSMLRNTHVAFDVLRDVLTQLGLTISTKKLVHLSTQAVCLGVLIDMVTGTVFIPDEKLKSIKLMVGL